MKYLDFQIYPIKKKIGGPWFIDMSCRGSAASKILGSTALDDTL
jgi:hypothetical protein